MDPRRALRALLVGAAAPALHHGAPATTFRSRALGALLFMAGLAAILAVTLVRA
jgi:hypothetical protein